MYTFLLATEEFLMKRQENEISNISDLSSHPSFSELKSDWSEWSDVVQLPFTWTRFGWKNRLHFEHFGQ